MSSNDLEISEKMIAAVVHALAGRGVKRTEFSLNDFELEGGDINLFVDALLWLSSEGIIRSTVEPPYLLDGTAYGFTLTAYGYRLLEQDFRGGMTLGRAIRETKETGRSFSSVGDFFGGLLGGLTKSISS